MNNELKIAQEAHIKKLYYTFNSILGTTYQLYVEGFEFCCYPTEENVSIDLTENFYNLVLSPRNQRDYDSITIENLNIDEILGYMNLITFRRGKLLWKAYYDNGGKKK